MKVAAQNYEDHASAGCVVSTTKRRTRDIAVVCGLVGECFSVSFPTQIGADLIGHQRIIAVLQPVGHQ